MIVGYVRACAFRVGIAQMIPKDGAVTMLQSNSSDQSASLSQLGRSFVYASGQLWKTHAGTTWARADHGREVRAQRLLETTGECSGAHRRPPRDEFLRRPLAAIRAAGA